MADHPFPTPILKTKRRNRTSERHSVTFSELLHSEFTQPQDESKGNSPSKNTRSRSKSPSPAKVSSGSMFGNIKSTPYGLCYEPSTQADLTGNLPPNTKLVFKRNAKRPELINALRDDNHCPHIVIFGDAVHAKSIKKELESQRKCETKVSLCAGPDRQNVRNGDFFIILLPLETIGSCNRVLAVLGELGKLAADYMFRCCVVGVSLASGRSSHLTGLDNLHTLVVQNRLSYYLWNCDNADSWEPILSRILAEVSASAGQSAVPMKALSGLLWSSDSTSYFTQQFLDQTLYRRDMNPLI